MTDEALIKGLYEGSMALRVLATELWGLSCMGTSSPQDQELLQQSKSMGDIANLMGDAASRISTLTGIRT